MGIVQRGPGSWRPRPRLGRRSLSPGTRSTDPPWVRGGAATRASPAGVLVRRRWCHPLSRPRESWPAWAARPAERASRSRRAATRGGKASTAHAAPRRAEMPRHGPERCGGGRVPPGSWVPGPGQARPSAPRACRPERGPWPEKPGTSLPCQSMRRAQIPRTGRRLRESALSESTAPPPGSGDGGTAIARAASLSRPDNARRMSRRLALHPFPRAGRTPRRSG